MAFQLQVDIVDKADDAIHATVIFWGKSKAEVESHYATALTAWPYLAEAEQQERVCEELNEVDDDQLPEVEDEEEDEEEEEEEAEEEEEEEQEA